MRADEFAIVEKKRRKKRRPRWAAYGPGPHGGYGFVGGYSGASGVSGGDGGGVGEDVNLKELNIASTLKFIKDAHGDQLYGKLPYWRHPRAVALTGRRIFGSKFNSEAVKTAFLHDVVEDTNVGLDELRKLGFSDDVITAVSLLTKDKSMSYTDNIQRIINSGSKLAMMVKYADNYENYTGDKSDWATDRAEASNQKYLKSLNILGDMLGVDHHLGEASYEGNVGMMEVAKFFKIATTAQKKLLKELLEKGKRGLAWKLIQDVTDTRLHGREFEIGEDRTADVVFDTGEKKKVRYVPGRKDIIDMIVRYYLKQGLRVVKVNDEEIQWSQVSENLAERTEPFQGQALEMEFDEDEKAVNLGRRKFLQRTAGAAAMAAAPRQTLGAIGKIGQQAANVAKAASTNATLRALGAAAVQAVVAHHKEFGGEIGRPINYDDDYNDDDKIPGYWDGTGADWDPSVDPTESPWGPSLVKQTVSGRTFIEIEAGFSGDDIILTFLNDKGQPSWVRVDWVGTGQLSVKDLYVPGMKEVDPHDISDIIEDGFHRGWIRDPDEPEEYSDKFRFPSWIRDGKEYEFLIDLLASGATSSNSGLKFAKKNPKWVEIASQYPYYDDDDDDYGDDNNTAKSAVADVAKSAATSGVRTQTIAGGLTAFKELVNRVLDKTNINRKKDEPAVKDMGQIQPTEPAAALPAPDRSAAEIMAQLRDVVGRDLTAQEREVVRQEVSEKS